MKTIVEPNKQIDKLWGKQRIKEDDTYRMMRYVLRVDHDDKVLLHNVVTGQLVVLDQAESEALKKLPVACTPLIESLVTEHYLVPEGSDEHQQVVNLREILLRLKVAKIPKAIVGYTILPTSGCNARCYYCFEHGVKQLTMTKETADKVVDFISDHCGETRSVLITWFGGEPTLATNRIDQISNGLQRKGVHFNSKIITNGYLFDEEMVSKAVSLWNLKRAQICIEGTRETYNRAKAYVSAKDDPYERVMRNIGLLLKQGVNVTLRMNFDVDTYQEFYDILDEAKERFGFNRHLEVFPHPIIGEYVNPQGRISHGTEEWFTEKLAELNFAARDRGLSRRGYRLPFMNASYCMAYSDRSVTVTPDGSLVECPEQFGEDQIMGTLDTGVIDEKVVSSWKKIADYDRCKGCVLFPGCFKLINCGTKSYCSKSKVLISLYKETAIRHYCEQEQTTKGG